LRKDTSQIEPGSVAEVAEGNAFVRALRFAYQSAMPSKIKPYSLSISTTKTPFFIP